MKRITSIKRMALYSFMILNLVTTSLFSLPGTVAFSEISPLTITINTPSQNEWLKNLNVTVSGNYSINDVNILSESDLIFTAYENDETDPKNEISNSVANIAEWNISDYDTSNPNGTWAFTKTLSEGVHVLKIVIAKRNNLEIKNVVPISFTVGDRPYISNPKIVFPDNVKYDAEDLTSVPTRDIKIKFTLTDNKSMDVFGNNNQANPIIVKNKKTNATVTGTPDKNIDPQNSNIYTLTFTPTEDLIANSIYLVNIDPNLKDDDNNPVLPIQFKFTTKSNMSNKNNPHGSYVVTSSNDEPTEDHTYLCANCHSTHIGSNPSLEGGVYQNITSDPNLVTWGTQNGLDYSGLKQNLAADPSINYCMACHDGTMNAPIVDNIDKTYHHSTNVADSSNHNDMKPTDSCTICHNPHLTWSKGNPNMLKDHYIYTSNKDTTRKIDSLDVSCGACHDDNAVYDINEYTNYENQVLTYKKSTTADGKSNNYSLCLRCHNADKAGVSNIKSFYEDPTSLHRISALDGKSLIKTNDVLNDGHLPCAECHDTHGSNNLYNLKETFGHENQVTDAFSFKESDGSWLNKEKEFCLKCHMGATSIYGVTGKKYDETRTEHKDNLDKACSYCHGGTGTDEQKALRAAHDPQIGVVPTP